MFFNTLFRPIFAAALLLLAAIPGVIGAPPESVDLLFVAASDAALQPLVQRLSEPQTERIATWTLWTGKIAGKSVVLARSEGDPLNAVAATTLAIRHHPPRLIFIFGTARAHDPSLHAGDAVVSASFVAFDGIESPRAEIGEGSHPLNWGVLPHLLMTPGEKEVAVDSFPADAIARELALALKPPHGRIVAGVLGSAYQTNREADRVAWIREHFHTSCEDTESAHVAGCAALLGVPAIGVRVIDGTEADAAALALQFAEAWK